jgi:hypothetical protein
MAKAGKEPKKRKIRAEAYQPKVTFDGTFEQMIGISVKDAEKRMAERKEAEKKDVK